MTDIRCDVAIIGAGTAGLAAERAARRAGAKTVLIDEHFGGTTCAAVGCMPSKLLIAAANAAHDVKNAHIFGICASSPEIDGRSVMQRLQEERDTFVKATLKTINEIPAGICVKQRAAFFDDTTLALDDGRKVNAKAVVVATGASPSTPEMFKELGDIVQTNETIFEIASLPRSLAVIGAGPLGLELAQAFARLGVETAVFEKSNHLAALRDPDVAPELRKILAAEFAIHTGVEIDVGKVEGGARLTWSGATSGDHVFESVLVAAGRPPKLDGLNLDATNVQRDDRGTPKFDSETLQCGDTPIFLTGDVNGERPVLHEASFEGTIAGRNAVLFPNVRKTKRSPSFSIMFTDPPLAVIGQPKSETSAVGSASFTSQGRAKVDAKNMGAIRVYADRAAGRLTGAVLLGPGMDHAAHLFAWAIARDETAAQLLRLPFYHPTVEEGLKPALRQICEAVDEASLTDLDDGTPSGA